MKRTVFNGGMEPYSLHDMNVIAFDVDGEKMVIRTQSGMVRTAPHHDQVDGWVEIHDVDWDFCYAYVYEGFLGNTGAFSGRKMYLKDFIGTFKNASLSVMDTSYGYNRVCYSGYLSKDATVGECMIEIYYFGELVFCERIDEDDRPMKEVILSADGDLSLCLVPADVADNLASVCNKFAGEYVWHGPKNGKFLKPFGEQYRACFTEADFIDYLNEELYPRFQSGKIKTLGGFDDGVPEVYQHIPWFNF